jgi:uncharacterized protein YndB with AHSA1/START domain
MTDAISNPVLEITRIFDAPPARVFAAWLTQEQWASWIGPEGVRCDVPLLEPRVGGRYRLTMHLPDGRSLAVAGFFKAIVQDKSFAFTWGMAGEARETLVSVALRDLGGRTELTLRHEGLADAADRKGHGEGWNSALNKLAAFLSARRPASAKG